MKNKNIPLTDQEKQLLTSLSTIRGEVLDMIRSGMHSASIKKGYKQPALVLDHMSKIDGIIDKGLERYISFSDVQVPEDYSQKDGYSVDVYVETEKVVYLIDPKSAGHNNNTPISDEVKKWVLAKQQTQIIKKDKEVRFILLKPSDVDECEFIRLKSAYHAYGIELHKTDDFLSDITGTKVTVSDILKEKKYELMKKSIFDLL